MLSKSQYIRSLQCHRSLWLYKHRPEKREQPDAHAKSLFETGNTVGDLACELFPGGIEIEFDPNDYDGMVSKTRQLIDDGVEILYEAVFRGKGIFAIADILIKRNSGWDMLEVKASTGVKGHHQDDAAIQWYALSSILPMNRAFIVHVNNQYVRNGDLDIQQLFSIEDITKIVTTKQSPMHGELSRIDMMLEGLEPQIDIGLHCHDPYECDFKKYCWRDVPSPSVFDLYRMPYKKKFDLFHQGVVSYQDMTMEVGLSETQAIQIASSLNNKEYFDPVAIKAFLDTLVFPLSFFDFETFQNAIPRFDGQRPYMQMPFQYSLHIVDADGVIEHKAFLGDEGSDPRESLVCKMIDDIEPTGSIVAFNMSFEKSRIRELAEQFPKYNDQLISIQERFVDLIEPFRNLGYYHPDFNGSFSIKSVLPALFPDDDELDYKKLEIQDGGMAMDTFANLHLLKDQTQREQIRNALLDYCHLDTLAMVKIWGRLKQVLN